LAEVSRDAAVAMDTIYRTQRHIYDASRKYFLLGRDRMLDGLAAPAGASILEVGCGTGRNLILAARRYPDARLYGFDISEAMLETAARSIERAGLQARVRLALADAARIEGQDVFGLATFDRVFFSYTLSMIPPWQEALFNGWRSVAPGGSLHVVDFGEQSELPDLFRRGLRAWLGKFSVTPRAQLEDVLSALAERDGARLRLNRLYRDYARLAVLEKTRS
jgi:S-adenosylmethionine-diacylgycerolhomoserine-N-methlytransferase